MKLSSLASVALALAMASTSQAQTWNHDLAHSGIAFEVRHMVVSTTRGQFDSSVVTLTGDPSKPATLSAKVVIPVASIDTRNEKRDEHLRAPDFFDVAKYPVIEFQSTKVTGKGRKLVMHGDLTMKGVRKTIAIPFTLSGPIEDPWKNTRIGFEGAIQIDRKEFGVGSDTPEAIVGEKIEVKISYEGILQK